MKKTLHFVADKGRSVAGKAALLSMGSMLALGALATPAGATGATVDTAPLTAAVTDNLTAVIALVGVGFGVTAFFIGVKIIRKGASKVG